jgi:aminoglycoside phosphotransferase
MEHGYTNTTQHVGDSVLKRYRGPEALERAHREAAVLDWAREHLPVPELRSHRATTVEMLFVRGRHGQDVIANDAETVLRRCGEVARLLHSLEPPELLGAHRQDEVIVHGDFGPQNLLLNDTLETVVAVFDWEHTHLGHPVEDLAWAEWVVRQHHPDAQSVLGEMYDAYGHTPSWSERQASMIETCRMHRELARGLTDPGVLALWQRRLEWTRGLEPVTWSR